MPSLIALACFDTEENNRTWMTEKTLLSLLATVNLEKHDLYVIDNASCQATKDLLKKMQNGMRFQLITNGENVGTARAINQGWKLRKPGQHCLKLDNDVTIHENGWVDLLEEAIERNPTVLGQIGLKRKDLQETPNTDHPFYKTELHMLPHKGGERWIAIEVAKHIIGTCVMHNHRLIDKVGGLFQHGVYSFDDAIMSLRSNLAGFSNAFIPHIDINHIDPGDNIYQKQKEEYAGKMMEQFHKVCNEYKSGERSIYHPFE